MIKLISVFGVLSILLLSTPVAYAFGEGEHPWDLHGRRTHEWRDIYPRISDEELYFSTFWSKTHALHPYNRQRYYDEYIYDYQIGVGWTLLRPEHGPEDGFPLCDNYSYERPTYRDPPFWYECQF